MTTTQRSTIAWTTCLISLLALTYSIYILTWILSKPEGSYAMREVSEPIRQGSEGFLKAQYGTIFKFSILFASVLFLLYYFRQEDNSFVGKHIGTHTMAIATAASFMIGAACSAMAGYVGMWVSVRANVRVAAAALKCYDDALRICFRGGAFAAIINVALAVFGVSSLYICIDNWFWMVGTPLDADKIPFLMVGFGFGASFVAMFAQLGGGIYTKAADVGADLIGKIEAGIPEDDPRNPAVIADLVGDNVGDCAGQAADLFESISAEIISAMILGGALAEEVSMPNDEAAGFILFPLAIHCLDLVVSTIGVMVVKTKPGLPELDSNYGELEDPLDVLKKGYRLSMFLGCIGFIAVCYGMLYSSAAPKAWLSFCYAGCVGIGVSYLFVVITQYYTDYKFPPVRHISEASTTGHATNIIAGLAVGLESTGLPAIVIAVGLLSSYYFGEASGLVNSAGNPAGGLFATATATMGMFTTSVYVLSMSGFGPIADNAGGIVEMSGQSESVRDITDRLDAVGNVTKANTKGYSVGSASLACFLLFSAFLDEIASFSKEKLEVIDIATPEVFVGGFMGSVTVFIFSSWAISAVGRTAQHVVKEVRKQFKADPEILTGATKPNYKACVELVAKNGLKQMIKPGLLALFSPLIIGYIFRLIGESKGRPLLGAEVTAAFLMFATCTGILMALFFNNGGGAWDNAKKYIETGKHGGKGGDAHKAAVTGDTVGDPCKDTAGPSIHILMKLLSTITLVCAPLFVPTI
eukprot:CAMPEP_0115031626 /NCGR_PEP_ID=MMETSP0216-20121206/38652_1 /TAXON_ID=223996 /ORGANISM="Protocruzia adherens, Strain Boccale" /LENGTH=752 /DNA_ID=CAMNT_0002409325 /DNA_START=192 /DNA_END=2450 /DNA_ORIENTATION=+